MFEINYKNSSGITLVALAITIIVLLILAGVSMQLFVGENGILKRTQYAKFASEIASVKEQVELTLDQPHQDYYSGTLNDLFGGNHPYNNKLLIKDGKLKYLSSACSTEEIEWFQQVEILEANDNYVVTFDANGGIVDAQNKNVIYNAKYGALPTPTREGYTFKGWNGKNKLDIDSFMATLGSFQPYSPEKTTFDGFEVWKVTGSVTVDGRNHHFLENYLDENITYTFSLDVYDIFNNNQPGIYFTLITSSSRPGLLGNRSHENWNFNSKTISGFQYMPITYTNGDGISYIKNFQIEEGSTATAYEPYYITSDTTVVQAKNHTLTAIWEEN